MELTKTLASFSSVNVVPIKVIRNASIVRSVYYCHKIPPIHLQLNPVNRCNFLCSFCSCFEGHDNTEMELGMVSDLASEFAKLGAMAVTITGGGEPLLHNDFAGIVAIFARLGYDISLVTNGALLGNVDSKTLRSLMWCRVSASDEHGIGDIEDVLADALLRAPSVSWGMSYVVTSNPNYGSLVKAIRFVNDHGMTHLRVVSDILDELNSPDMPEIKRVVRYLAEGIDETRIIYQGRKHPSHGRKDCRIGLLKPNITANGHINPCCVASDEKVLIRRNGRIINVDACDVVVGDGIPTGGVVSAVYSRSVSKLLEITTALGKSVIVSPDHSMIMAKEILLLPGQKRTHVLEAAQCVFEDVEAQKVRIGDMLPALCNTTFVAGDDSSGIKSFQAELAGYYVADGWSAKEGNQVGFMFGKAKPDVLQNACRCLDDMGVAYKIYERRTGMQVMTYSREFALLAKRFGRIAIEKRIDETILNAPMEAKMTFLKAYARCDGNTGSPRKEGDGYSLNLTTASRRLASDLLLLLKQIGIDAFCKRDYREGTQIIEGRTVNVHDVYRIQVRSRHSLRFLVDVIGMEIPHGQRDRRSKVRYPRYSDFILLPVTDIREYKGDFTACDLTVTDSHRFVCGIGNILVNNCGIQYAREKPDRCFPKDMMMGHMKNIQHIWTKQSPFDGSQCVRCYYDDYNSLLANMLAEVDHENFV